MANDFLTKNKRNLIVIAILGILVGANLMVRLGRSSTTEPRIPTPTMGEMSRLRPDGALQANPSPAPGVEAQLVFPSAIPARPEEFQRKAAWTGVLRQMKELEDLFAAIPEILPDCRPEAPFATPSRDIFTWAVVVAAETITTVSPTAPGASVPVLLGQIKKGGRTHLLVRSANRVYLVSEGEGIPDAEFRLISLASGIATLENRSGKTMEAMPSEKERAGVQHAIEILRGKQRLSEYRVVAFEEKKVQNQ